MKDTNPDHAFDEVCHALDADMEAIGAEALPHYRLCPLCLTFTTRLTFDQHAKQDHGYDSLVITRRRGSRGQSDGR